MDRKICFFIGHRDTPALLAQVERHITELGAKNSPQPNFLVSFPGKSF